MRIFMATTMGLLFAGMWGWAFFMARNIIADDRSTWTDPLVPIVSIIGAIGICVSVLGIIGFLKATKKECD